MSARFEQRLRKLGEGGRPSSMATIGDEARGREIVTLPVELIAPDPAQVRFLPAPEDLLVLAEEGDEDARALLAELRSLGRSLAERQLHPVVVYALPDADPAYPAAEWRLLSGERRWRAAVLAGLPVLSAVQLPRQPGAAERLVSQYAENEARSALSDLDRAEAALRLKSELSRESGSEVAWSEVETRLGLGESRRMQLQRLYERLPVEARPLVRRYRWPERTLRPLHTALFAKQLPAEHALRLLEDLRVRTQRGDEVSATLVGKLLVQLQRGQYKGEAWLDEERARVQRMTTQGSLLLRRDLSQLSAEGRAALRRDLEQLQRMVNDALRAVGGGA